MIRVVAVSAKIREEPPATVDDVLYLLSPSLDVKPPFTELGSSQMELEVGSSFDGPDEATIWMDDFPHPDRFKPLKTVDHHIIALQMRADGTVVGTIFINARAADAPIKAAEPGSKVHPLNFTFEREAVTL